MPQIEYKCNKCTSAYAERDSKMLVSKLKSFIGIKELYDFFIGN